MARVQSSFVCPVCARTCGASEASRHHVLPKSRGGRAIAVICVDCHKQIHVLYSVKQIARNYPTLEALKAAPDMQTWVQWIGKKRARQERRMM